MIRFSMVAMGCALAQKATSFYSTTNAKFVAVISDSALEKEPEIDHFEHLYPGYGGYELLHRSGDARSWIEVRYKGTTSDLYSATMKTAAGFFPYQENDVVEWRGNLKGAHSRQVKLNSLISSLINQNEIAFNLDWVSEPAGLECLQLLPPTARR